MATTPRTKVRRDRDAHLVDGVDYPTSDGKPMGETDLHRNETFDVITALGSHFEADPAVYVTGNRKFSTSTPVYESASTA